MSKILTWLRTVIHDLAVYEPAVAAWALSGGLATVTAYLFHFTHTQEAATAVIVTAVAAAVTAALAHPPNVTVVTGAVVTVATGLAAFGWHASPHVISVAEMVAATILGLLYRANLTPRARRAA